MENERRLREAYDAFVAGDLDTLLDVFHPDAQYVNPPYAVESGTRQGRQQLTEVWRSLHEMFEFSEVDVLELREGPNGVFVQLRLEGHGRVSGAPTLLSQSHLLELRDGRAVSLAWFGTREEGSPRGRTGLAPLRRLARAPRRPPSRPARRRAPAGPRPPPRRAC